MSRALRERAAAPVMPPKGKAARAASVAAEPLAPETGPADPAAYGPAKLRLGVLARVKAYCAAHGLEMQTYLSDVAEADLRARGYSFDSLPPLPDGTSSEVEPC